MQKKILLIIITFLLSKNAYGNTPTLRTINNSFNVNQLKSNVINVNHKTLFPVRETISHLGYEIVWDNKTRVATIYNGSFKSYITKYTIYKNHIYLSLDDINKHLAQQIYYSNELNVVYANKNLSTNTLKSLIPSYNNYNKEDLKWLTQIVSAEARGETFSSQVDVANVVINRTSSSQYPNNIYAVIFDKKNGVQFTPTINGQIYKEPTLKSYLAALEVLEKTNFAMEKNKDALFFINPVIASSSWVHNNRKLAFASGNHNFYY